MGFEGLPRRECGEWCDCCHADFSFGLRLTDPSPNDGQKLVGIQAGAADEGAVNAVGG